MKMKKMTSEKKHKITTIGLWLILILCTAVLFSLCLSEGIDYDEAYSYRMLLCLPVTSPESFGGASSPA